MVRVLALWGAAEVASTAASMYPYLVEAEALDHGSAVVEERKICDRP